MANLNSLRKLLVTAAVMSALLVLPGQALAIKYMGLKDAIKYFMPAGAKPSKVAKSIPPAELGNIKKKFKLKETTDFKEKISKGPYTFYVARDAQKNAQMYILILEQYWRTCYHKYAIGIQPDGTVKEIVVVELNCHYAYPINKKSFLKQFKGKKVKGHKVPVHIGEDVDVISGATASSDATAIVTRRAMALHELFFGAGAK